MSYQSSNNNELSRLINSRKDELHKEFLNTLLELLNKGDIKQNNKPIEATEQNAKTLKTFLWKKVSEENPQFSGMDKILQLKKMNDSEIIKSLTNLPNFEKYQKEILLNIEKNKLEKEKFSSKKNNELNSDSESEPEPKKKKKSKK